MSGGRKQSKPSSKAVLMQDQMREQKRAQSTIRAQKNTYNKGRSDMVVSGRNAAESNDNGPGSQALASATQSEERVTLQPNSGQYRKQSAVKNVNLRKASSNTTG